MSYVFRKKRYLALASMLDGVGERLFKSPPTQPPKAPKKILVVRLDHLGDVLQATGIPQVLKEHFPSAEVLFLTSEAGAALLANNPYVDETLVFNAPWFNRPISPRVSSSFRKLAGDLKRRGIDVGLSLRGDVRENFLLRLAGVGFTAGYGITGGGFLLNRQLSYRPEEHESRHSLDVLRSLGIHRDFLLPALFFSQEEEAVIDRLRTEAGQRLVVGVQLDAGSKAKCWPEANRGAFLDEALETFPAARFVFFGTDPGIRDWLNKRLKNADGEQAVNLMGKTSVRELALRLKSCRLFIGPDSGPTHLAAALGIPTLFLYSGTNEFEKWRSVAENADFLRNPVSCSPCHLTECPVEGHPCLSGISAKSVLLWLKERVHVS